jgi:hemin uptake protein HemP
MIVSHTADHSLHQGRTAQPKHSNRADCLDSDALLRGQKAVEINHNGATYKLQTTKLGKLILTK